MDKKYKSAFTGHDTTAPQYLAEIMCMRQAAKKGEKLPEKFWNAPKWRMPYKQQIIAANSLLKIYEPDEIMAAIHRKDSTWIFSLRFPGLNQIILEEKDRLDKQKASIAKVEVTEYQPVVSTEPSQPFRPAKNIRKLDD